MALNWVQTTTQGDKPVPLPQEKIFLSIEKCNLSLEFNSTKQKWTADGTSFVTSQRIIFLRQPPLPTPSDLSIPSQHLRSLSIPIERLLEARYMIPIFGSPYYEARVLPVKDGGLPQPTRQQGTDGNQDAGLGLLKIWFSQGGGIQFREAVEEVKSRLDEQGGKLNHLEQLPSYEPPPSPQGPSRTTSTTSITQPQPPSDSLSNLQIDQNPSTSADPTSIPSSSTTSNIPETISTTTTRRRPQRSGTLPPDTEDLEAARVAREIEERENLENLNRDGNQPPPELVETGGSVVEGNDANQSGGVADGAPPGYEEACER